MKIDVMADQIKRVADALERIAEFQELEYTSSQEKFDFSS